MTQKVLKKPLSVPVLLNWLERSCDRGECSCSAPHGGAKVFIWNDTAYRRLRMRNMLPDIYRLLRDEYYFKSKLHFLGRDTILSYKRMSMILRQCLRSVPGCIFHVPTAVAEIEGQFVYHINVSPIYDQLVNKHVVVDAD